VIFKFGPNRFHQISKKKTAAFLNPSTEARAAGINKIAGRGIWGNPRLCFIHRDHEWCKAKHRRIARRTQNDALLAHSHTHTDTEKGGGGNLLHAAATGHTITTKTQTPRTLHRLRRRLSLPIFIAFAVGSARCVVVLAAHAMDFPRCRRDFLLPRCYLSQKGRWGSQLLSSTGWRLSALNAARLYPSFCLGSPL
jgi:hypothetical protein